MINRSSQRIEFRLFLKVLVGFMLFILLMGIGVVNSYHWLSNINRFTGIMLIFFSILIINRLFILPLEAVLYGAFIVWAIVSGLIVAQSSTLLFNSMSTLVQLFSLFLIVINLGRVYKDANLNFLILMAVAMALLFNTLIEGQITAILFGGAYIRESSFMSNPNDFGSLMCLGIVSALFFLGKAKGWQRLFLVGLIILFAVGVVLSSSRKGFVTLLVLIASWLWFCYRKVLLRRPVAIILIAAILIGSWYFTDYVINNTFMGARMLSFWMDPQQQANVRLTLYQEAFEVFKSHPLAGVGLSNFQLFSSSGYYAHSDYAEILADTGVFGVIFYFSMYLALWLRLNRLERKVTQPELSYHFGVFKAAILSILVIGLGQPNYDGIFKMFLIATIIGYTFFLEKRVVAEEKKIRRQVLLSKE